MASDPYADILGTAPVPRAPRAGGRTRPAPDDPYGDILSGVGDVPAGPSFMDRASAVGRGALSAVGAPARGLAMLADVATHGGLEGSSVALEAPPDEASPYSDLVDDIVAPKTSYKTTGTQIADAVLPEEDAKTSYGKAIGREVLKFGADLAADPLTYAGFGGGVPGKVAGAAFTGLMAHGAVEAGKGAYEELLAEGWSPDVAAQLTRTMLEGGGAAMGARHLLEAHPTNDSYAGKTLPERAPAGAAEVRPHEAPFVAPEQAFALPADRPFDVYPFEAPAAGPTFAPEAPAVDVLAERDFLRPDMTAATNAEQARLAREYVSGNSMAPGLKDVMAPPAPPRLGAALPPMEGRPGAEAVSFSPRAAEVAAEQGVRVEPQTAVSPEIAQRDGVEAGRLAKKIQGLPEQDLRRRLDFYQKVGFPESLRLIRDEVARRQAKRGPLTPEGRPVPPSTWEQLSQAEQNDVAHTLGGGFSKGAVNQMTVEEARAMIPRRRPAPPAGETPPAAAAPAPIEPPDGPQPPTSAAAQVPPEGAGVVDERRRDSVVDRRETTAPVDVERRIAERRAQILDEDPHLTGNAAERIARLEAERDEARARAGTSGEQAHTDPTTGLLNKRGWDRALEGVDQEKDHVMIADLSGFKPINDRIGHVAGDEVLGRVAAVMKKHFGDDTARQGGDEFGAILRNVSSEDAPARIEAFRKDLRQLNVTVRNRITGETLDIPGFEAHIGVARDAEAADLASNLDRERTGSGRNKPAEVTPSNVDRPEPGAPGEAGPGVGDRQGELGGPPQRAESLRGTASEFAAASDDTPIDGVAWAKSRGLHAERIDESPLIRIIDGDEAVLVPEMRRPMARAPLEREGYDVRGNYNGVDPLKPRDINRYPIQRRDAAGKWQTIERGQIREGAPPDLSAPRFAAAEAPTKGATVTADHVRSAFPTGKVSRELRDDAGARYWSVNLPNGKAIKVEETGSIRFDRAVAEKAYEHSLEGREAVGSYRNLDTSRLTPADREGLPPSSVLHHDAIIQLAKDRTNVGETIHHEAFHAAMDLALHPKERDAVLRHYKNEEAAAEAYAQWNPRAKTNSFFGKIRDFFRNIYRSFKPTWESAFEQARSGKAFERGEKAATPHKFSSTQVDLPASLAREVKAAAGRIPDADLAGDGRETDPHITVKFGIHDEQADAVRAALAGEGPIRVRLGKTSSFPPSESSDGAAVIKVDVDSPDLHRLNGKIADAVPTTDTHPEYKPHVTLAYVKPEAARKYVGDRSLAGREVTIDRITFSGKDGSTTDIPLSGSQPKYATAPKAPPQMPERKLAPIPEKKAEDRPLGRPMVPGEAPRVEHKVAALEEVSPDADLSRNAPRTWESLDPAIRKKLGDIAEKPALELGLYERARTGRLNDVEVQTLDALVTGKREAYDSIRERLLKAQEEGRDTGPENVTYLRAALDRATAELALAARSDVEAGTRLGRALAARARVMEAAKGGVGIEHSLKTILRQIPDVSDAQATQILKIMQERPQDLADALIAATNPSRLDKYLEWWKAGLVSAPGTQIANILGNVGEQIVRLGETATSAALDPFLGGPKTRLSGEARFEAGGAIKGASKSLGRLATDLRDVLTLAPEKIRIENLDRLGKTGGVGGRAVRIPFRLLSAFDEFFKGIGSEAELHKLAYRRSGGKLAEARRLIENPPADLMAQVQEATLARVFQDPNKTANAIMQFRSNQKWMHVVAPFVQTPSNIARVAWQRSPAGFYEGWKALSKYREAVRTGVEGEALSKLKGEAVDKLARPLVGTAILGTFYAYAKAGGMTGSGPVDPKDRATLRASGWQAYSFVVEGQGGRRLYIPFGRFEPVSSILGIAADAAEAADSKSAGDLFDKGLGSIVQNFTSKTYLQGITDAATAVSKPKEYLSQYVSGVVGSVVPNIVAKGAQAIDPTVRSTKPESAGVAGLPEKLLKTLASRIPGASLYLPPTKTGTGEDAQRPGNAVSRLLSPVQVSEDTPDADVKRLLVEIDAAPSVPKREVTIPNSHGKKVRLTDDEYATLTDAAQQATESLRRVVSSSGFKRLDQEAQRAYVRRVYDRAESGARQRLWRGQAIRDRARSITRGAA